MVSFKQWNIGVVPCNVRRVLSRNYIEQIMWAFAFEDFVETTQFPVPAVLL